MIQGALGSDFFGKVDRQLFPSIRQIAGSTSPWGSHTIALQENRLIPLFDLYLDNGSGGKILCNANIINATLTGGSPHTNTHKLYFKLKVPSTLGGSYPVTITLTSSQPYVKSYSFTLDILVPFNIATGPISGIAQVGQTLTAGALSPPGATATYQWQACDTVDGTYADIDGEIENTYILGAGVYNLYIKVVATGSGSYSGTVTSAATGPVAAAPLTSIGAINGTAQVGEMLTAGALMPSDATATYLWQRCISESGSYTPISGAILNTYTPVAADYNYFIKVVATGYGSYTGLVTSPATGQVAKAPLTSIGAISGTTQPGYTLTAGALSPPGATATYQWQIGDAQDGSYTPISGATASTYKLVAGDLGKYLKVAAIGTGSYSGTVTSPYTDPVVVVPVPLISIGAISGTAQVGQTLTAGALSPPGATATYQWQRNTISGGSYTNISGATASTYTPVAGDYNYFIKVVATGSGIYSGTKPSAYRGPVAAAPIDIAAISGVTAPVKNVKAVTTISATSEYTAAISWQPNLPNNGKFKSGINYTATITITAKLGYTLTGVTANYFTVTGATTVTNSANSGVVTAVFPKTQ